MKNYKNREKNFTQRSLVPKAMSPERNFLLFPNHFYHQMVRSNPPQRFL